MFGLRTIRLSTELLDLEDQTTHFNHYGHGVGLLELGAASKHGDATFPVTQTIITIIITFVLWYVFIINI